MNNKKNKKEKTLDIKKLKISKSICDKRKVYSGGCGYNDFSCTNVA
ncbi:MAG: hypothetical protein IJY61_00875 [Candidatus Gastranaerophilales bacterium]|nr:hypothetical protein [Candidatus Gastranaerophilales bacterium]